MLECSRGLLAAARDLDRMDLLRQAPGVAGGGGVLVGAQSERVDLLTRQLVAVGDVLRGLHHVHVCVTREQVRVRRATGAAHIVSSSSTGPRGMNGASPFM